MAEGEVMVGVDVSMARLDLALWASGENFSVSNDVRGVEQLLARMIQLRPRAVVIEAKRRTGRSAGERVVCGPSSSRGD